MRGVDVTCQDNGDIREVECWRSNVEYGDYGLRAADADAVECDGEEDHKPDRIDGCISEGIDS